MYLAWSAALQKGAICSYNRRTGGEHRVAENKNASVQTRSGNIFELNIKASVFVVLAVRADESIIGMVKNIQKSLVQGNPCAENGSNYGLLLQHRHSSNTQRSGYLAQRIWQM